MDIIPQPCAESKRVEIRRFPNFFLGLRGDTVRGGGGTQNVSVDVDMGGGVCGG